MPVTKGLSSTQCILIQADCCNADDGLQPESDHAHGTGQNQGHGEQTLGNRVASNHDRVSCAVLGRRGTGARRGTGTRATAGTTRAGRVGRVGAVGLAQGGEGRAGVDGPAAGGRGRALQGADAGGTLLVLGEGDTGGVQGGPLGLEIGEVGEHGGGCTLAGVTVLDDGVSGGRVGDGCAVADQTVVVGFLDPLVDNGAGPGVVHLGAKDSSLVLKGTGSRGVAASLGKENGDGVAGSILLQLAVSRDRVAGVTAPLVGVQGVKVQLLRRVRSTGHVVLQHGAQIGNVGSRVADRDLAVTLLVTIGLHVTGSSQDIGGSGGVLEHGEDFIADKDTGGVVKLLELIQDCGEAVVLGLVPVGASLIWSQHGLLGVHAGSQAQLTCSIWVVKVSRSTNK